jgi:hypothetical protein
MLVFAVRLPHALHGGPQALGIQRFLRLTPPASLVVGYRSRIFDAKYVPAPPDCARL